MKKFSDICNMKAKEFKCLERQVEVRDGKIFYKGKVNCYFCNGIIRCEIPEEYRDPRIKLECTKCAVFHDYAVGSIQAVYKKLKEEKLDNTKIK